MATVNKRVYTPQAVVVNGVSVGGVTAIALQEGFDNTVRSSPDGFQAPVIDRTDQFVRGTITVQDWPDAISLLTGTISTLVFYERKSGVAAATGYVKHTLTAPVVYRITVNFSQNQYANISADFECRAAADDSTITDMHAITDSQAAPTAIAPALGGWRIVSTEYGGSIDILHVTGFNFSIALPLIKACNDGDIANTAVDACLDGLSATGSLNFQDSAIATAQLTSQQLLLAAIGNLVITVKQAQAATDKVITIARAVFAGASSNAGLNAYTGHSLNFEVTNNLSAPLTLTGDNKIITIADAA